jgi:hypothetical protein
MLQVAAVAICDRPGENVVQRDFRTSQMVHFAMGFEPRDGVEYMLASLSYGHLCTILDSIRDVFRGGTDDMEARTKTTIVPLDRALISLVGEFRSKRKRPAAIIAELAPAAYDVVPVDAEAVVAVPKTEPAASKVAFGPGVVVPLRARNPDGVNAARWAERKSARPRSDIAPSDEDEVARVDRHLREFQVATADTLAECDVMDAAKATAATGD